MSKQSKMAGLLDDEDAAETKKLPPEEDLTVDEQQAPIATANADTPQTTPITQRIPDLRGKKIRSREKMYASLGISRKYLPPLTRKRSAIYQLLNVKGIKDKRMMEPADQYGDPQPYELVPNYTFIDLEETDLTRMEKTLTYTEGTEIVYVPDPITKRNIPQSKPKEGSPMFTMGQVVVSIFGAYPKYVWWELHPLNASNKWRDKSRTPIFERIDTKYEGPHVAAIRMDLALDAERYILSLKPDGLMNLAASMTNPTVNPNTEPQSLRLTLRERARKNPEEILFTSQNRTASTKIAAIHALDLGILTFIPEHEAYYFADEEDPFFQVPVGNNPFDALCDFLITSNEKSGPDNLTAFERIKTDLDFWF